MLVRTAEELHALPYGSVVIDASGTARTKRRRDSIDTDGWAAAGKGAISAEYLADGRHMNVVHIPGRNMINEAKAEALSEAAERTSIEHVKKWLTLRATFYRHPAKVVAQGSTAVESDQIQSEYSLNRDARDIAEASGL